MIKYRTINGQLYNYHHTASAKGYASRKVNELIKPYSGKFGRGYKVCKPALIPLITTLLNIGLLKNNKKEGCLQPSFIMWH